MKQYIINENDANQRMDKFLTKAVPKLPQSLLYKYLRTKRIKLNGKKCEISTRLTAGDMVELYINDEFFEVAALPFLDAPSSLDIIYEDDNILLLNKPAGLIVHEDDKEKNDTLINRVLKYLYEKQEYRPQQEHSFTPSLCNRIDRNTGGIVIAAKTATALRILNQKIKDRELDKYYLCIVHGVLEQKEATLKAYHIKDEASNLAKIYHRKVGDAKTIFTKYRVLQENDAYSLLEIELLTGRTHQIRAHMAFIGHPLAGDTKYGLNRYNKDTGYRYQALYSYKLTFHFTTDAEELEYLNHQSFTVKHIPFAEEFRGRRVSL